MILEVDNWYLGYSQILRDCRGGAVSEYQNTDDGGSVWNNAGEYPGGGMRLGGWDGCKDWDTGLKEFCRI